MPELTSRHHPPQHVGRGVLGDNFESYMGTPEDDPEAAYWDSRDHGNTHEVAMIDAYSIPDLPEPDAELEL